MEPLPIVFIHRSDSPYLKYTLGQARTSNPGSRIILLGDSDNDRYPFVEHFEFDKFLDDEFARVYVHLSSNGFEYEKFCFERWFVLRNFLEAQGLTGPILYLDSDVMLYADTRNLRRRWEGYTLTVCKKAGPQYSYFRNFDALADYCRYLSSSYANPDSLGALKEEYRKYQLAAPSIGGGICDMWLLADYVVSLGSRALDLNAVSEDGGVFDNNINVAEGYATLRSRIFKRIRFRKGVPYVFRAQDGTPVRLDGAHFQGGAKRYCSRYFRGEKSIAMWAEELHIALDDGLIAAIRPMKSVAKAVLARVGLWAPKGSR
jgi:hypothetical protein